MPHPSKHPGLILFVMNTIANDIVTQRIQRERPSNMPTKKKASSRKRDHEADIAELEELRKQIAQRDKAEKARKAEEARKEEEAARKKEEAARKEEESQGKRQVSSRRQRTLVRWDGMWSFLFLFPFYSQSCFIISLREFMGVL